MPNEQPSVIASLLQTVYSTRIGAWFGSHTQHYIDRVIFGLSGGRTTLTGSLGRLPTGIVTTVGAKSGLSRTIPLLLVTDEHDGETFALIASNWGQKHHPAWYYNLKANPRAMCSIYGQSRYYIAHEASGEEYERFWQRATQMYAGYALYKQRVGTRHIPILVMNPA
jgi:deazaflavin-dependent oxidoreductase (nitroreductase family)